METCDIKYCFKKNCCYLFMCRNYFKYDKLKELGDMCKQMANDSKSDKLYTLFFFVGKRRYVTFVVKLGYR